MRKALILAAALAAVATPALAEQTAPAGKLLPFLDKFLKVPPAERTRLKLSYALRRDGQPLANLKATLVEKTGARTPLPVNGEGYFERLPTLSQIEGGAEIVLDVPADAKLGKLMSFGTQLKPAGEYDARELAMTVTEANTVIGKAAGPMAFMAPKMTGIAFPKAESGMIVFADGHSTPLPEAEQTPYFRPADHQGAVRVKLTKTPTKVAFYDGKK
ncbi:hypothetical protein [Caulobacter sp. 1776]|uniref:hypothetical protein n=1 Tax=Caulobacter sp. 1776 TaxID=3156420 RepID=UPI003399C2D8